MQCLAKILALGVLGPLTCPTGYDGNYANEYINYNSREGPETCVYFVGLDAAHFGKLETVLD